MSAAGVYVHVPFCRRRCHFCSFRITTHTDYLDGWQSGVLAEIDRRAPDWEMPFDTVYFGGGTPSLAPAEGILRILDRLRERLDLGNLGEVTLEANPGDLDANDLRRLRDGGVTRLSIGIQSFDDGDLGFLTRHHSAEEGVAAIGMARDAGFRDLTIDLLYGLPDRPQERWEEQIDRAAELGPDHVSAYLLAIEPGTPFFAMAKRGRLRRLPDERQADLIVFTHERLAERGYRPYEISSFARAPKFESRHNRKYWEGAPYLGIGPAAHSFRDPVRFVTVAAVREYARRMAAGESVVETTETLDEDERRLERLFLGLRTTRGVPAEMVEGQRALADRLIADGVAVERSGRFVLTRAGLPLADGVAARLA